MARRGPADAARRRTSTRASSRRRRATPPPPKPKQEEDGGILDWFRGGGNDLDPLYFLASPFSPLLKKYGGRPGRAAGSALTAFGAAPVSLTTHPKAAAGDVAEITRGLIEMGPAMYRSVRDEGFKDTGSMLWESMKDDYKTRYGADWEKHAKDDPLFNFLDVAAVFGGGFRGAALGSAFTRLGAAGVKRGPRSIWKESSRPGLLSEGEARTREVTYEPPTGAAQTANQPYSRSPTRRVFQDMADELAERYPTMPMMGARSRVARATSRQQIRDTERQLAQMADPHAIKKLSKPLQTRLYWAAQLGDHSTAALKQFRDLYKEALEGGDLPDDPDFREVVIEARKRGFGKQAVDRLDEALKHEPDDRYWRAEESMRDMTALSEQTIRDANGFQGLHGDLRRARDRLKGMDPELASLVDDLPDGDESWIDFLEDVDENMHGPVADVMRTRDKLTKLAKDLDKMFPDRRNRIRDWRNGRLLLKNPSRIARLEELTKQLGAEQAEAGLALYDAIAKKMHPSDPGRWYDERVGEPVGETPDELVARLGQDPLWQRQMALRVFGEELEGHELFYSPLQKYVTEAMPKKAQAKQLPGMLRKAEGVKPGDLEESGVLDWLATLDPDQMVTKEKVIEYFANPANAYGIEEISLSGFSQLYPLKYEHVLGLWSREGPARERRQIIFRAPGKQRYTGAGEDHWEMDNVVAHIRFREIEVNGKRTMIVEEIQSDWLDDWLEGKEYTRQALSEVTDPDAYLMLLRRYREERPRIVGEWEKAKQELRDLDPDDEGFPEKEEDVAYLYDRMVEWEQEFNREGFELGADPDLFFEDARRDVPRSPLSEEAFIRMGVRRLLRYAAEKRFDEIIIPSGNVHRYRYAGSKRKAGGRSPRDVTAELAAEFGETQRTNKFNRLYDYGRGVPKQFAKELGQDGEFSDEAFTGRYAYEMPKGENASKDGAMPGTVFRLTADDHAKHSKPAAAFQRQPNWKGLPKGANELLRDGAGNLIHMFSRGDISTWVHELGHSALYDLAGADRKTIEEHFAGGRDIGDWVDSEHENFARTWEQYVRNGVAPTDALREVFQKLSEWMQMIWEKAKQEDIPIDPKVKAVFDRMLTPDPANDVDIFIPHRATEPDVAGGRTSRGIPRASKEIGDRAFSRIPIFARNRLALMRMGMLKDDPGQLVEHVNRMVMLARANQIREAVLEMAEPLMGDDIPRPDQYAVKKAGRGVNRPVFDAMEATDDPEEIRTSIKGFVDDYITDDRQKWEAWKNEDQLYVVDKKYVDLIFKNITGKTPGATTKPDTGVTKLIDAGLDGIRAALLYANPGFYTANILGNATMLGLSDPRAARFLLPSMKQARRAAFKPETADPTWRRISTEIGRGPTSGGLSTRPPLLGREASRRGALPVRVAETGSLAIGEWGRRSGRIIDDAMRVAAWKQVASKFDYTTDAEINKLLDDATGGKLQRAPDEKKPTEAERTKARRDLAAIRDESEQLMLDFDSMTPFEKSVLTRTIFLYPFLKASAKWPFMFLGERPITAGLTAEYARQGGQITEDQLGPRPDLPLWMSSAAEGRARAVLGGRFGRSDGPGRGPGGVCARPRWDTGDGDLPPARLPEPADAVHHRAGAGALPVRAGAACPRDLQAGLPDDCAPATDARAEAAL